MSLLRSIAGSISVVLIAVSVLTATDTDFESGKGGVFIICILFGSVFFFFGKYLTASGFSARGGYVDTSTPEFIWSFAGIVLYAIALLSFIFFEQ